MDYYNKIKIKIYLLIILIEKLFKILFFNKIKINKKTQN